ncbi:MAG: hypothetical protein V4850_08680 [Myxococcota bacterium]
MSTSSRFDAHPTWRAAVAGRQVELYAPRRAASLGTRGAAEADEAGWHTVAAGERLDLIAQRWYGDPLQSWRILDANEAAAPTELETVGRRLRIPRADR